MSAPDGWWAAMKVLDEFMTAHPEIWDEPCMFSEDSHIVQTWDEDGVTVVHVNERVGGNYCDEWRLEDDSWVSVESGISISHGKVVMP